MHFSYIRPAILSIPPLPIIPLISNLFSISSVILVILALVVGPIAIGRHSASFLISGPQWNMVAPSSPNGIFIPSDDNNRLCASSLRVKIVPSRYTMSPARNFITFSLLNGATSLCSIFNPPERQMHAYRPSTEY